MLRYHRYHLTWSELIVKRDRQYLMWVRMLGGQRL